jgi:hypothetical protein
VAFHPGDVVDADAEVGHGAISIRPAWTA